MSAPAITIPYEAQSDPQGRRDCGAACLRMVYLSFKKDVAQTEIWPAISGQNRWGRVSSATHLMTRDALARGFAAVAIQARHPLQALRVCRESGTRAILNLRLEPNSPFGHFAVLVDIDDQNVILHDPFYGPSQRLPHAELLELWQPRLPNSEILGNLLIGVAPAVPEVAPCWLCHTRFPAAVACPHCGSPVAVSPAPMLGCCSAACVARIWNSVCCPACDCIFTFSVAEAGISGVSSAAKEAAASDSVPEPPLQLDSLFAELDKFCAFVAGVPGVTEHSGITQQLQLLESTRERLKLAQTEAMTNLAASRAHWSKVEDQTRQQQEEHRRTAEELKRPSSALDGDVLGRALMRNLGFIRS